MWHLPYTSGLNGNVWVSDARANEIHAVGPTGVTTDYNANEPIGLTAGPHGSIWYTEVLRNSIGRIALGAGGGSQQEFPLPTDSSSPLSIAAGADGDLWFTESATDQIGRITPASAITEFPALSK